MLALTAACGGRSPAAPSSQGSSQPTTYSTTGRVLDVISRAAMPSVAVQPSSGNATTSDASGNFTLVTGASASWTTTVKCPSAVERSVVIRVPGPEAIVTLIPASYDMTAFSEMFRIGGVLQRWVVAPPLLVLKRTLAYTSYGDNVFVASDEAMSQAEAEALVADLSAGLTALTGGAFGGFAVVSYEEPAPGASVGVNRAGMITVARFKGLTRGSGYWGYGRWATNSASEVVGGIVMLDHDFDTSQTPYRRSLRIHELGHALGYFHVTVRQSVMNSSAILEPTEWDRQAAAIAFQRPPGNRAPDADPSGVSCNLTPALRLRGVAWGPIIP